MNSDPAKNLLVFRFSSLGDLALLYPTLKSFLSNNLEHTIILVTKKQFASLFKGVDRLIVFPVEIEKFNGLFGLFRLARLLNNSFFFEMVIDQHQVLRTHVLNFFLSLMGKKIYKLQKSRKDREALTRKENKIRKQLPHATDRYQQTFKDAGFEFPLDNEPYLPNSEPDVLPVETQSSGNNKPIGFAPFATWDTKVLPIQKCEELLFKLDQSGQFEIHIFCSRNELSKIEHWKGNYPSVRFNSKPGDLYGEVQFMKTLSLMISMDSANIHLAAIAGVPVMTIWGSTHRQNGFAAVNSLEDNDIEVPASELSCRPCSIFGDKTCWRGDHACMNNIDIDHVFRKIVALTK